MYDCLQNVIANLAINEINLDTYITVFKPYIALTVPSVGR